VALSEKQKWIVFGGLSVVLSLASIAAILGPGLRWGIERGVDALPPETEERLGLARLDSAVIAQGVQDPRVRELLDRLAKDIAAPGDRGAFKVVLINDPLVNAFATPGGTIVLHTGITRITKDESELFGVLGHEAGHVRRRHGLKALIRSAGTYVAVTVLAGDASGLAGLAAGASAELWQRGYGRRAEEESDDEGLATLERLRLDPAGVTRLFAALDASGGSDVPEFLSTHPTPKRRRERLADKAAPRAPAADAPKLSAEEWALLRQIPSP
jgi:predicted Zn-dependent protease